MEKPDAKLQDGAGTSNAVNRRPPVPVGERPHLSHIIARKGYVSPTGKEKASDTLTGRG